MMLTLKRFVQVGFMAGLLAAGAAQAQNDIQIIGRNLFFASNVVHG